MKECEQFFTFYFTSDHGMAGNYSISLTLSFTFPTVDRLTSQFMGIEYDAKWGTGARPFYTVVPNEPLHKYKYCSEILLIQHAQLLADDFRLYALPFYEKYQSLADLESYFDKSKGEISKDEGFRIIRSQGKGCCIAAVFCLLGKWDKLQRFLGETDLLSLEQEARIKEYAASKQ